MEANQKETVCIRKYRIIKKGCRKTVRKHYTEKRQRGEIKAYIEKLILQKPNELFEEEFIGFSFFVFDTALWKFA